MLAAGLGLLLLAALVFNLLLFVLAILVLGFSVADTIGFGLASRGFSPGNFRVQRFENSSQIAVEQLGSMALTVTSVRPRAFYAEIFDAHPDQFEAVTGSARLLTWFEPAATKRLAYLYRPHRRGRFALGPTHVVAHDPFGLAFRMTSVPNPWAVEVLPEVAFWRGEALSRLRSHFAGRATPQRRGLGTEFRSLREYQSDDDYRTIAWKRSTLERLYVREFEEEHRTDVVLLLDVTRPMAVGPSGTDALDLAVEGALLLSRYAYGQGDRVGLVLHASRPLVVVPMGRRFENGYETTRALSVAAVEPGVFDLGAALEHLARSLARPAAIVGFSALEPVPTGLSPAHARLRASGHRLSLLVPDPGGLFPRLADPLADRALSFASEPARVRTRDAIEASRGSGIAVRVYDRENLVGELTELYAGFRRGEGG